MGPDPAELEDYFRTGHTCASEDCDGELFIHDELVLIQVVYPNLVDGRIECYDIDDGTGEFVYEPCFLHMDCWLEFLSSLDMLLEDSPPILDPLTICDCTQCKSGIRAWETSCLITPGEFERSSRSPNGYQDFHFAPSRQSPPMILCASCTARLNEEIFEMWEQFSHNGECPEGTHKRCWRTGECQEMCQELVENW